MPPDPSKNFSTKEGMEKASAILPSTEEPANAAPPTTETGTSQEESSAVSVAAAAAAILENEKKASPSTQQQPANTVHEVWKWTDDKGYQKESSPAGISVSAILEHIKKGKKKTPNWKKDGGSSPSSKNNPRTGRKPPPPPPADCAKEGSDGKASAVSPSTQQQPANAIPASQETGACEEEGGQKESSAVVSIAAAAIVEHMQQAKKKKRGRPKGSKNKDPSQQPRTKKPKTVKPPLPPTPEELAIQQQQTKVERAQKALERAQAKLDKEKAELDRLTKVQADRKLEEEGGESDELWMLCYQGLKQVSDNGRIYISTKRTIKFPPQLQAQIKAMNRNRIGPLSLWVRRQRTQRTEGKLASWKIELLNRIHFPWEAQRQEISDLWKKQFESLKAYLAQHGGQFPQGRCDQLSRWCGTQQKLYRNGLEGKKPDLQQARKELLDSVHFPFSGRAEKRSWEEWFADLCQYKAEHGHVNVPFRWKENVPLADWVKHQRRNYALTLQGRSAVMTQDKIQRLQAIGFVFDGGNGIRRTSASTATAALVEQDQSESGGNKL